MKAFTAAALQMGTVAGPVSVESVAENTRRSIDLLRQCVAETGADLVVFPETVTTGFTPTGTVEELWNAVSDIPGEVTRPFQEAAAELRVHLCVGTYERGLQPTIVHNSSVLIDPAGAVVGVYRKTHPFGAEARATGGWVTPGADVCVVDTELGRIGMIICFDGDFPELSRIQAVMGAEVLCRPSALLRSADIWDLTSRARAYDNHVYVVGANATGLDAAGVAYFGNSHIVTPLGNVVARAASHPGWVTSRLDPDTALSSLTPGSNIRQGFDHLADRNLELIRKHRPILEAPAASSFERSPRAHQN